MTGSKQIPNESNQRKQGLAPERLPSRPENAPSVVPFRLLITTLWLNILDATCSTCLASNTIYRAKGNHCNILLLVVILRS